MSMLRNTLKEGLEKLTTSTETVIGNLIQGQDDKKTVAIIQVKLAAADAEREMAKAIETAKDEEIKNLSKQITLELQSKDPFVRRARPSFNYVFYIILIINYIFIPLFALITGKTAMPIKLPEQLWYVFGIGFVGYGYLRTVEKTGKKYQLLGNSNNLYPLFLD